MEHYRIRANALELLESYVTSRIHYVTINGKISDPPAISHLIPQGSLLGPLVFHLSMISQILPFADDTNIFFDSDIFDKLAKEIKKELKYIMRFSDIDKLSLNISNACYLILYSS